MHVIFSYNLEKDVENIIKSTKSRNNREYTRFQKLYIEKYGEAFDTKKLRRFVEEHVEGNKIDIEREVNFIRDKWVGAEDPFIKRVETIFGINCPHSTINVYLTNNERCTYNVKDNYF